MTTGYEISAVLYSLVWENNLCKLSCDTLASHRCGDNQLFSFALRPVTEEERARSWLQVAHCSSQCQHCHCQEWAHSCNLNTFTQQLLLCPRANRDRQIQTGRYWCAQFRGCRCQSVTCRCSLPNTEREGKRKREGAGVKQVLFSHLLAGWLLPGALKILCCQPLSGAPSYE